MCRRGRDQVAWEGGPHGSVAPRGGVLARGAGIERVEARVGQPAGRTCLAGGAQEHVRGHHRLEAAGDGQVLRGDVHQGHYIQDARPS